MSQVDMGSGGMGGMESGGMGTPGSASTAP